MSNPDHEALVEAVVQLLVANIEKRAERNEFARTALALVLAKMDDPTSEMAAAFEAAPQYPTAQWRAMLRASPLSPGRAEDKSGEAVKP